MKAIWKVPRLGGHESLRDDIRSPGRPQLWTGEGPEHTLYVVVQGGVFSGIQFEIVSDAEIPRRPVVAAHRVAELGHVGPVEQQVRHGRLVGRRRHPGVNHPRPGQQVPQRLDHLPLRLHVPVQLSGEPPPVTRQIVAGNTPRPHLDGVEELLLEVDARFDVLQDPGEEFSYRELRGGVAYMCYIASVSVRFIPRGPSFWCTREREREREKLTNPEDLPRTHLVDQVVPPVGVQPALGARLRIRRRHHRLVGGGDGSPLVDGGEQGVALGVGGVDDGAVEVDHHVRLGPEPPGLETLEPVLRPAADQRGRVADAHGGPLARPVQDLVEQRLQRRLVVVPRHHVRCEPGLQGLDEPLREASALDSPRQTPAFRICNHLPAVEVPAVV
ncbi:FAD-binding domain-containing protein [Apiospora arundinis]